MNPKWYINSTGNLVCGNCLRKYRIHKDKSRIYIGLQSLEPGHYESIAYTEQNKIFMRNKIASCCQYIKRKFGKIYSMKDDPKHNVILVRRVK